jgi:hypothetical protein
MLEQFRALMLVLFVFALGFSAMVGKIEKRVGYYTGIRS